MGLLIVGVGDCRISREAGAELVTYALGSCVAVAIWDPPTRVSGLLHFMLPDSRVDCEGNALERPFRYADTGVPLLFRRAYELGAEKQRLIVRLAGGASVVDDGGLFNIGKQNYAALKRILRTAGVTVHAEDCGGSGSRTVRLEAASGRMWVRVSGEPEKELAVVGRQGSGS